MKKKQVAEHFGYKLDELAGSGASWANDGSVPDRIGRLPEALDFEKKFRVIVDYDPEFQRALLQVFTD